MSVYFCYYCLFSFELFHLKAKKILILNKVRLNRDIFYNDLIFLIIEYAQLYSLWV